jgi:hypothetical protein
LILSSPVIRTKKAPQKGCFFYWQEVSGLEQFKCGAHPHHEQPGNPFDRIAGFLYADYDPLSAAIEFVAKS